MSSIQQILASILNAVYGKDVRQAIHDGVEMAYNKADDAATSAAAAAEAASGSQESAAASAQAASNSASSASDFADAAEQYKDEAFDTTPAGYEEFVSKTNSSLNDLYNNGVKNLLCNIDKGLGGDGGGITYTKNADGSITANGTTTGRSDYPLWYNRVGLLKAGTYKISGVPTGNVGMIQIWNATRNRADVTISNGASQTFTYNGTDAIKVQIIASTTSGVQVDNVMFKPMITVADAPNSDYAHYVPYAQSNAALTEKLTHPLFDFDIRRNSLSLVETDLNNICANMKTNEVLTGFIFADYTDSITQGKPKNAVISKTTISSETRYIVSILGSTSFGYYYSGEWHWYS